MPSHARLGATEIEDVILEARVPVRVETLSHVGAKTARVPFQIRDIRRTCETTLAAMGVAKGIRAKSLSHGLGGVQDRHNYLDEKRVALKAWGPRLAKFSNGTKRQSLATMGRKTHHSMPRFPSQRLN